MATQTTFINETTPGKSWLVYWELRGIPVEIENGTLTANATFTCGKKVYKVVLDFHWTLQLEFKTTEGNEN